MAEPVYTYDEKGNRYEITSADLISDKKVGIPDEKAAEAESENDTANEETTEGPSPLEFIFMMLTGDQIEEEQRAAETIDAIEQDLNEHQMNVTEHHHDGVSYIRIGDQDIIDWSATLRDKSAGIYRPLYDPGSLQDFDHLREAINPELKGPGSLYFSNPEQEHDAKVMGQLKALVDKLNAAMAARKATTTDEVSHKIYVKLPEDAAKRSALLSSIKTQLIKANAPPDAVRDANTLPEVLTELDKKMVAANYLVLECKTPGVKRELEQLLSTIVPAKDMDVAPLSDKQLMEDFFSEAKNVITQDDLLKFLNRHSVISHYITQTIFPAGEESWDEFAKRFDGDFPFVHPVGDWMDWTAGFILLAVITYGSYMAAEHPEAFKIKRLPKLNVGNKVSLGSEVKENKENPESKFYEAKSYRRTVEVDLDFFMQVLNLGTLPFPDLHKDVKEIIQSIFKKLQLKGKVIFQIDDDPGGTSSLKDVSADFSLVMPIIKYNDFSLDYTTSSLETSSTDVEGSKFGFGYIQEYRDAMKDRQKKKDASGKVIEPDLDDITVRSTAGLTAGLKEIAESTDLALQVTLTNEKPKYFKTYRGKTSLSKNIAAAKAELQKKMADWNIQINSEFQYSDHLKSAGGSIRLGVDRMSAGAGYKREWVSELNTDPATLDSIGFDFSYKNKNFEVKPNYQLQLKNGKFDNVNYGAALQWMLNDKTSIKGKLDVIESVKSPVNKQIQGWIEKKF